MSLLRSRTAAGRRSHRDEGEKPFWISFSDLMTALMVLFLVALTVALLAVTHDISENEHRKSRREDEIATFLERLQSLARQFPGVEVRGSIIDFGDRARFDTDSHRLSDSQARLLRAFVPRVLQLARDPAAEKWLKRIVVEGFADARGSYLHNLDLSLRRSERVLCALLAPAGAPDALGEGERAEVRALFRVGGASFNALKGSPEESRRIELRLEFREPDEALEARQAIATAPDQRCPLDP